jgi:predicted RND superfamily exporter protein
MSEKEIRRENTIRAVKRIIDELNKGIPLTIRKIYEIVYGSYIGKDKDPTKTKFLENLMQDLKYKTGVIFHSNNGWVISKEKMKILGENTDLFNKWTSTKRFYNRKENQKKKEVSEKSPLKISSKNIEDKPVEMSKTAVITIEKDVIIIERNNLKMEIVPRNYDQLKIFL